MSTPITVWPFSARTAAIGAPNFPSPMMDSLMISSLFANDRHAPARSESARRNFQARRGLLAFKLGVPDHAQNAPHRRGVVSVLQNLAFGFASLHVALEDFVEDLVRRQRILIRLVGPQFGGRR